jgi:hypothetical protein
LRIDTFTDQPGFLLLCVPEGTELRLPPGLRYPFKRNDLADVFGKAKIDVRIRELASSGILRDAMNKMRREQRSESAQRQSLREAREHSILRGASSVLVRSHSEAVLRKQEVDEKLRQLKATRTQAVIDRARTGRTMPRKEFAQLEQDIEDARLESQALQFRMGELRKEEKRAAARDSAHELHLFKKAVEALAPDAYEEIAARVEEQLLAEEDGGES